MNYRSQWTLIASILMVSISSLSTNAADKVLAHPREAMKTPSGLWVVAGVDNAALLIELAEHTKGRALIQGLSTNPQVVETVRNALAKKGLIPLVDVKYVKSYEHLPYTDELLTGLIINEPGLANNKIPDAEVQRALFFGRPVLRGSGNQWSLNTTRVPDDIDEWNHALYGPERIPLSKDKRVGPWVTGIRFLVGDRQSGGAQSRLVSRATRLAGGRMFVRGSVGTVDKRGKYRVSGKVCRALDAGNGLPLWEKEIVDAPADQNTYVPRKDDVIGFFCTEGRPCNAWTQRPVASLPRMTRASR